MCIIIIALPCPIFHLSPFIYACLILFGIYAKKQVRGLHFTSYNGRTLRVRVVYNNHHAFSPLGHLCYWWRGEAGSALFKKCNSSCPHVRVILTGSHQERTATMGNIHLFYWSSYYIIGNPFNEIVLTFPLCCLLLTLF